MTTNLYARREGTTKPDAGQVRAVWAWLQLLRRNGIEPHLVGGAVAAAEWVIGLSNVVPIRGKAFRGPHFLGEMAFGRPKTNPGVIEPATTALIAREIEWADEAIALAGNPNAYDYAAGVHGFLCWWAGIAELPPLFVPDWHGRVPAAREAGAA